MCNNHNSATSWQGGYNYLLLIINVGRSNFTERTKLSCYLLEVSLAMVHLVFHLIWIYETLRTIYLVHTSTRILHMGSEFAAY
jgi:hypothetical protein